MSAHGSEVTRWVSAPRTPTGVKHQNLQTSHKNLTWGNTVTQRTVRHSQQASGLPPGDASGQRRVRDLAVRSGARKRGAKGGGPGRSAAACEDGGRSLWCWSTRPTAVPWRQGAGRGDRLPGPLLAEGQGELHAVYPEALSLSFTIIPFPTSRAAQSCHQPSVSLDPRGGVAVSAFHR